MSQALGNYKHSFIRKDRKMFHHSAPKCFPWRNAARGKRWPVL